MISEARAKPAQPHNTTSALSNSNLNYTADSRTRNSEVEDTIPPPKNNVSVSGVGVLSPLSDDSLMMTPLTAADMALVDEATREDEIHATKEQICNMLEACALTKKDFICLRVIGITLDGWDSKERVLRSTINRILTGMPTQVRKGEIYDLVTLFVTTLSIGHYERWPQCPDLLRKSWRYVMELPYVPALSMYDAKLPTATVGSSSSIVTGQRSINFLFAGRLNLWGPERVCSVRKFVTKLASRSDTVILHVSEPQSMSPTRPELFRDYLSRSVFCIVTKADSYSTSFFYSALHAGCVPIIVSDWFVFAFPWLIRYEEFSIRILEEDFLKNPHEVIDHVFAEYLTHANKDKLSALQRGIAKWIPFLSFGEVDTTSEGYKLSQSMLFGPNINVPMPVVLKKSVWPWELMLYELRYAQLPEKVHPIVPCYGPFKCTWNGKTLADVAFAPFNTKVKNKVVSKLAENRTHLCKHSSRLIGHYKIVYFMQCVRILWPLTPGKLNKLDLPVNSPVDRAVIVNGDEGVRDDALKSSQLDGEDLAFVLNFHALTNMSKAGKWSWTTYPTFDEEKRIRQFT
jgi:hypothetical protein